jgi:hypothetical protein
MAFLIWYFKVDFNREVVFIIRTLSGKVANYWQKHEIVWLNLDFEVDDG